jgi:hypothetical protein
VHLLFVGEHGECFPKFGMQLVRCVAHDGQATALSGAIAAERGHDDVATWLERTQDLLDVGLTVLLRCQEVEHGAVMPEVDAVGCKDRAGDVRLNLFDASPSRAQAVLTFCQRGS